MNKCFLILLPMIILVICSCDEKFSGDDKAKFSWTGKYGDQWGTRDVHCDGTCSRCSVYVDGFNFDFLDEGKYKQVYEYCDGLTKYTPPKDKQVNTSNHDPVPTGKISFDSSSSMKYGFDSWKNCNGVDKKSYISIAEGCSTYFCIKVDGNLSTAYNRLVAVLPRSDNVSFSKGTMRDTFDLTTGTNEVKIFALSGAVKNTPIDVNVYGIEDPARPACLAGDCYGSDDKLGVVVYNKKTYNDYRLYLVNTPAFNPDTNTWKTEFNKIIKQGVIEMGSLEKITKNDMSWDLNGNGLLDFFISNKDIPPDNWEEFELLKSIGEVYGCASDSNPAIIVIKGELRKHWVITEDVNAGEDMVTLNSVKGLSVGDNVYIGPWLDINSGDYEWIYIQRIWENINVIEVSQDSAGNTAGLKFDHLRYETFWESNTNGVTLASCSFVKDNPEYSSLVHEFLHQTMVGGLSDLNDSTDNTDNIMHGYSASRTNKLLRYRELEIFIMDLKVNGRS